MAKILWDHIMDTVAEMAKDTEDASDKLKTWEFMERTLYKAFWEAEE